MFIGDRVTREVEEETKLLIERKEQRVCLLKGKGDGPIIGSKVRGAGY